MKAEARLDISVGGPTLAAAAIGAGLVDECHLFVVPVVVGGSFTSTTASVREETGLA